MVLLPRPGWRDSEVRAVMRRAVPALAQAGLDAVQLLALLIAADRLPGGIVAFQIAWNLYNLANNVGTTPVALSLVPRLARMHLDGDDQGFRDTLVRGLALGFFVTIPAAVALLFLARCRWPQPPRSAGWTRPRVSPWSPRRWARCRRRWSARPPS